MIITLQVPLCHIGALKVRNVQDLVGVLVKCNEAVNRSVHRLRSIYATACMPMQSIIVIPSIHPRSLTIMISILLSHILFIFGLACEQNVAAINKSHVTVSVEISLHSRPP